MPYRKFDAGGEYRYGFNGKENDNEVKGDGNQQDYGMRIYDTRLGRFLSVDPLTSTFPFYTPYHYAGNSPIENIDLDGAEDLPYSEKNQYGEKQVNMTSIRVLKPFRGGSVWATSYIPATPAGQPATQGMTDVQVYQLAFNRFAEPGKHTINSNQYIDKRLLKAEQQVKYFYTHNVPGWSKSESATRIIHTQITADLFSGNEENAQSSVKQIQIVDDWDYNISLAGLTVGFAPIKAFQNITSGLSQLSKTINRNVILANKGFQSNWSKADIVNTMEKLLGKDFSKISLEATETGKVVWSNKESGYKIIQDPLNKYFRIQNKDGHYVGADGKQVITPSKLKGKAAKEHQRQQTHFNY